jgi:hypothetical protein
VLLVQRPLEFRQLPAQALERKPGPGSSGAFSGACCARGCGPALLLTLSDLDGRAVGARVFTPREYLGAAPTQATLASGQSAMLSMDVLEPGPRIVAFTFDFRYPACQGAAIALAPAMAAR